MTTVVQNQDETVQPPRLTRREKRKYDKILMGFLPIARNDVFTRRNIFSQIVHAFEPQIEGAPAHDERLYELSEMQVLCQPTSNVLSICEQGETEIHEWTLQDKEATKRTIQDGEETASEVFKVLPGDRDFMLNLLTRFYTERSKCEFEKFGITLEEENDLHDWPFLTSINTKELVLKLPPSMVTITDRLEKFLLTLITYPLQKTFLECSPELFYEISKRKILPTPKLWLSFTSFDYNAVKVNTAKWLHLTCTKKTIRLNEFQKVFELYADPSKNGWHFEIEMPHIKEEMIVITQLTSNARNGFSKRKYQEKVAASKKLENDLEVVAYFNDSESVWIVKTGKFESKEVTPEPPILEVSIPKPKVKVTLDSNGFRFFKSVILDFVEFKLTCDGEQEKYKSEFDAQKALKELLEECPKYHIKSMVIIGTYILFCRSPLLSVSELTLLYEDPHMFSFFTPFRHCRFDKLTVSTEECLENYPSFTTQAKKFIALDRTPIEPEVEEPPSKTTAETEVEEPPEKRAKTGSEEDCSLEPTNTSASHCSPESAQTRRSSRRTTKRTRKPTPEASETPRRKSRRSTTKREETPPPPSPESTSPPMAVSPKDSPKESPPREHTPRERSTSTTSSRRTRSRTRCRAPSRSVTPPQTPPRRHRSRLPTPIISSRSPSPFSRDLAAAIALSLEPQNNHIPDVYRRIPRPPLDYSYIPYFSSRYVPEPIFFNPIHIKCCSYTLEPFRGPHYDPFDVRLSSPPARYSSPFETNRYQNDWPEAHMLAAEYNTIEYQDDFENLPGPSSMY